MATNLSFFQCELRLLPSVIITSVLLAVSACGGAQRPSAADQKETRETRPTLPALEIPSDPFQLLPAECFAGLLLDVRAYRESALHRSREKQNREALSPDEDRLLQYFLENTESAALGVARDPNRPEKGEPRVVAVLRGDYELAGILALKRRRVRGVGLALLADLVQRSQVRGITSPEQDLETGTGRFLEFYSDRRRQGLILDEHTIVLASRDLMPSVLEITARPDQAARFADTELCRSIGEHARLGRSALSVVFSVQSGMTDAVKDGAPLPSLFAKYEEAVRNITGVGASVSLADGIQIDAAVVTTAEKYPSNLVELTNALIFAFGLVQKDKELKQLVDSISMKAEGKLVRLGLRASEQQLLDALDRIERKLIQAAEEQGPGSQPPTPPAEQPAGKKSPGEVEGNKSSH